LPASSRRSQADQGRRIMSQTNLEDDIKAPVEPLLPIEKKLIGWSLGIGIALLVVLITVNHFVPIKL
jgi:hypothetical protein